jgi:hypothetical protein
VKGGLFSKSEDTSGFNNVISTSSTPLNFVWVSASEDGNFLTVNNLLVTLSFNGTVETSVSGIVLGKVDHVVKVNEWIVYSDNFDVISFEGRTED